MCFLVLLHRRYGFQLRLEYNPDHQSHILLLAAASLEQPGPLHLRVPCHEAIHLALNIRPNLQSTLLHARLIS